MNDLDDIGVAFAQACQEQGIAGFAVRTLEDGDVRLIGLTLPPKMVARMLRTAAEAYEAQVAPETVN